MKISVLGHEGRLGIALKKLGAVPLLCDITKPEEVRGALRGARPDVIINCAAITDVDRCEDDLKEKAIQVHIRGVQNLIDAAQNIFIIHISTDFIFNGAGEGQYKENARPSPINAYGLSKYASELILQASGCRYTIVRTTQLYGSDLVDLGTAIAWGVSENHNPA
jgi:dTDP-4-dehydrorhamnose reductase